MFFTNKILRLLNTWSVRWNSFYTQSIKQKNVTVIWATYWLANITGAEIDRHGPSSHEECVKLRTTKIWRTYKLIRQFIFGNQFPCTRKKNYDQFPIESHSSKWLKSRLHRIEFVNRWSIVIAPVQISFSITSQSHENVVIRIFKTFHNTLVSCKKAINWMKLLRNGLTIPKFP